MSSSPRDGVTRPTFSERPGLTVVISHFAPPDDTDIYRNLLLLTIHSVRSQKVNFEVEIIICDDGSAWSSSLSLSGDDIRDLCREELRSLKEFEDLDVDRYLYIGSGDKYYRARLLHLAYSTARFFKIVSLDDDNPLTKRDALSRFYKYLDHYVFVRGRIIGPGGIPQLFSTTAVQGSTVGFTRQLYEKIGGLGNYLFQGLSGADDDLTWKIFSELRESFPHTKMACYAGEIVTQDLMSGRWVKSSFATGVDSIVDPGQKKDRINELFEAKFREAYGVSPVQNPCRDKCLWMVIPSFRSWISEIYYIPIYYIRSFPGYFGRKISLLKRIMGYCRTADGRKTLQIKVRNKYFS
jgi:hypothetical protein